MTTHVCPICGLAHEPPQTWPPVCLTTLTDYALASGTAAHANTRFASSLASQRATVTVTGTTGLTIEDSIVAASAWNAMSLNQTAAKKLCDVTLRRVLIEASARMGIEATGRGTSMGLERITLADVEVAPQGSEGVSFDGTYSKTIAIDGLHIRGAGNNLSYSWGQGFELNKVKDVKVRGLVIDQCRGSLLNLSGPAATVPCGWDIEVDADATRRDPAQTQDMKATAQALYAKNLNGAVFSGRVVAGGTGGDVAYLDNCRDCDFTAVAFADARKSAPIVWQRNGCSGNKFPAGVKLV